MALVKRVAKVDASKPGVVRGVSRSSTSGMKLPLPTVSLATEKNVPLAAFGSHSLWVHSAPGVGKTTLCSQFPDVHLFMFEPGAEYVAAHQKPVNHWLEWVAYKEAFKASKFKWAAVDIVEDAFQMCFDFMCNEVLKIEHPNDEKDFGKSWGAIYTEFFVQMYDLIRCPGKGAIFCSHTVEKLFTPGIGEPCEKLRPGLSSKPLARLLGKVTVCGYLYRDSKLKQNVMQIRQDESILAKCRPDELFRFTDGSPIHSIQMGNTAAESYAAYYNAFHNKLKKPAPVQTALRKPLARAS